MIQSGEGLGTVIRDLVITGGSGVYGGGIFCIYSDVTLDNCTITGNSASSRSFR